MLYCLTLHNRGLGQTSASRGFTLWVRMKHIVTANEHVINVVEFRKLLIDWGEQHFRPFPWRLTESPYQLLMAEIMLHRTQASQVTPVYETFMKLYPHLFELTQATKEELREVLYPLGLLWRTDLIYDMASILTSNYKGKIPSTKSELLSLPGVSDYIASAVRCFAWGFPDALVDTNTTRVVGRIFGLEIKDSSRRNLNFKKLIAELVDANFPGAYHYALLDFADKVCTKKRLPDCEQCPLLQTCVYGQFAISER